MRTNTHHTHSYSTYVPHAHTTRTHHTHCTRTTHHAHITHATHPHTTHTYHMHTHDTLHTHHMHTYDTHTTHSIHTARTHYTRTRTLHTHGSGPGGLQGRLRPRVPAVTPQACGAARRWGGPQNTNGTRTQTRVPDARACAARLPHGHSRARPRAPTGRSGAEGRVGAGAPSPVAGRQMCPLRPFSPPTTASGVPLAVDASRERVLPRAGRAPAPLWLAELLSHTSPRTVLGTSGARGPRGCRGDRVALGRPSVRALTCVGHVSPPPHEELHT